MVNSDKFYLGHASGTVHPAPASMKFKSAMKVTISIQGLVTAIVNRKTAMPQVLATLSLLSWSIGTMKHASASVKCSLPQLMAMSSILRLANLNALHRSVFKGLCTGTLRIVAAPVRIKFALETSHGIAISASASA